MTGYTRTLLEEGRRGESGDAGAGFRGFSVVAYAESLFTELVTGVTFEGC